MTEKPSAPTSAGGEGETGACDIGTLPTPSRTGCKESEQEKGQQRCASSSGNAVVVVDDDVTAPVPAEFPTSRRAPAGASKLSSVYSLSGQVLGEVAVTAEETVGALKEKLCDATGSDQYMDLASQMAILKDSDSIAETGLLESSHVQAAALNISPHDILPEELTTLQAYQVALITVEEERLVKLRQNRVADMKTRKMSMLVEDDYTEVARLRQDLQLTKELNQLNPHWPEAVDMTYLSPEECASLLIRQVKEGKKAAALRLPRTK